MGRGSRITITGIIHHVINRGNNRQVVFRDDSDYKNYIELIERYKEKYGFRLYSYVLMSNHIHLLIEAGEKGNISKIMQGLTLAQTKYFGIKYKTSGHVWQGRFKSPIVGEESYLLEVSRYIELNPVRTSLVKMPEEYEWHSYATHAYGKKNLLIEDHVYYESLGKTKEERQTRYREFVKEGLSEEKLKAIRDSVISGKGYGSEEYLQKVEESIKARLRKGRRGRPKKKDT